MKSFFILVVSVVILFNYGIAQKEKNSIPLKKLQGTYQGFTSQDIGNSEVFYKTIFKIKINKDNSVKGKSIFYDNQDSTQVLVVYNFEGNYQNSNQTLKLKEYEVVQKSKDWVFCFKEMPMAYVKENNRIELRGTWTAKNCPNTGGKIRIIKQR
ncbi:MAG: hypothetical protein NZ519_12705 [Bacteroidia bacterium]|nr:hypothetical protein [Bacteroidia bacterium]